MPSNPFKAEPSGTRLALNRIGLRVRNLERRFVSPGTTVGVTSDVLYLDLTVGTVTSDILLEDGIHYLITVQGTYTVWNKALDVGTPEPDAMFPTSADPRVSTDVGYDAECLFAYWSGDSFGPYVLGHADPFKIDLGSGAAHIEPDDGPHNIPAPGHQYKYTVVGQGSVATFSRFDAPTSDNYGKLLITIQALDGVGGAGGGGGGGVGGGTGTGSLVPPTDPSLNGESLQVQGGIPVWSPLIWRPAMTLDPTTGNYLPVTTGSGDCVLTEA